MVKILGDADLAAVMRRTGTKEWMIPRAGPAYEIIDPATNRRIFIRWAGPAGAEKIRGIDASVYAPDGTLYTGVLSAQVKTAIDAALSAFTGFGDVAKILMLGVILWLVLQTVTKTKEILTERR